MSRADPEPQLDDPAGLDIKHAEAPIDARRLDRVVKPQAAARASRPRSATPAAPAPTGRRDAGVAPR